jgi:SAM-dependent methyltransferase
MSGGVQTWHYGLVAHHRAEHNTDRPEIAFFQRQIETYGQPVLDAGCGTGRLLLPFLRAGLDVDGCDVSGDMLDYCRQAAGEQEYQLHYRLLSVDPLEQHIVGEMRTFLFKDNEVLVDQTYTLAANLYFHHEMRMLLEQAGFHIEAEKADLTEAAATADSDAITYVACK